MKIPNIFIISALSIVIFSSCYSFKGISIPTDVNTFYVENFQLASSASAAPADINMRFTEALRAKIRTESRLKYAETNADIEFSGSVEGFSVTPEAPQQGSTVALNKFQIIVKVNFTNNKDETQNWNNTFSFFRTFGSDKDFISIQEGLVNEIFKQLTEDVFNKAFTSW
jgi:hypothetical protein